VAHLIGKTNWDWTMDEGKWMREDFRRERVDKYHVGAAIGAELSSMFEDDGGDFRPFKRRKLDDSKDMDVDGMEENDSLFDSPPPEASHIHANCPPTIEDIVSVTLNLPGADGELTTTTLVLDDTIREREVADELDDYTPTQEEESQMPPPSAVLPREVQGMLLHSVCVHTSHCSSN
jgi:hypothetical protein